LGIVFAILKIGMEGGLQSNIHFRGDFVGDDSRKQKGGVEGDEEEKLPGYIRAHERKKSTKQGCFYNEAGGIGASNACQVLEEVY